MKRLVSMGVLAAALAGPGARADWTQWRGPTRNGVAAAAVTARWPPGSLPRAWSIDVGEGHSSPVMAGDRVYVHSRVGADEVIAAFAIADGRRLWSHREPVPYTPTSAAAGHGSGPKATPLLHQGRLYAFGITGVLTCLDMATGRLVWRRDWTPRFKETYPVFGTAQSPLGDGDRVIVHVGGSAGGALIALDAATGVDRWTWAPSGDGPAYASPVIATIHGVRQVVTLTEKRLAGVAAADGSPLWSAPFTTMYDQNAVTPVVSGDMVVVSGIEKGITALRIQRDGAGWAARPAWEAKDASFYMSSPVVVSGRLIGFSHRQKGQVVALDLATGRQAWAGPGRQGENASLVVAGSDLLVLNDEGELLVLKADADRFSVVATYGVAESATWAHLAVAPNVIIVKDVKRLTLWRTS